MNPTTPLRPTRLAAALLPLLSGVAGAQETSPPLWVATHDERVLERVTVTGSRPSTLPLEIPTTTEGVSAQKIERGVNATDSSDALKYLPSLNVRKRHIGDYDHAVLATRASGTGNSARSLVYADGILLSNLLGNGAEFTPRWGLVAPEEIERVDVLYGPFSAAYPGNSAGAIVDYVTRMPDRLEAHVKLQGFTQDYKLYRTDDRYSGSNAMATLGSRSGAFAWWLSLNRLHSDGQPLVIARQAVPAATSGAGTPVSGAVPGRDHFGNPVMNLGSTAQTDTRQDLARIKLAWDLSPTLRASYSLARWGNDTERRVESFLRDAAGNPVYSGTVNIDGRAYTLPAAFFAPSRGDFEHLAHGLTLKSHTRGTWDWQLAASLYDYARDQVRTPTVAPPGSFDGGAGRIVDQAGTGWNTLAAKGIWRPEGSDGAHVAEFGLQRDAFQLRRLESTTSDWRGGTPTATAAAFRGDTQLTSLWAQDAWRFAPAWRSVLGLRVERWQADNGQRVVGAARLDYPERRETHVSPKAALAWQASEDWTLKASIGRTVRLPTVSELYQGGINTTTGQATLNDPNLKPEKSHTTELTAERELADGLLRTTLFHELTQDALYSQLNATTNTTFVQNVDRVRTTGLEIAFDQRNVGLRGLDLNASLTWADSTITRNAANPAYVGKRQPRVPEWRASVWALYAFDDRWSGSLGARYSGTQYGQLDNSDVNGFAYQGFSRYFVVDARLQFRIDRQWQLSLGVDNLGNEKYWAFHPYPQRTFHAELRFDL
ncbi:TonB-dependent receptor [uncultured Methylibium sp.]|uniref:TonB-dependent receptor n=1 Tax=uncultured Methylibium sp. TaxID=381093 RepID=UPI0025ED790B|nr:TonB-dependent receptor [uncultured Methylibium sp.]